MKNYNIIFLLTLSIAISLFSSCKEDDTSLPSTGEDLKEHDYWNVTYDTTGTIDGHKYVDLGLSVKWATVNIGAGHPLMSGQYFAWGETGPKDFYNWDSYAHQKSGLITKYCNDKNAGLDGFTDEILTLEPQDDAAAVNWGGAWRMPTADEMAELRNKCEWTWIIGDGVNYYKVTADNGNSILIPACGCLKDNERILHGLNGCLWTSSLSSTNSQHAYEVTFYISGFWGTDVERFYGEPIRAVCD